MRTRVLLPLTAAALLAACVAAPPRPIHRIVEQPPPPERVAEVIVYPAQGQTLPQLDRDRYECHNWAVKQTGFDPSVPGVPPHQRVRIVEAGPPPGAAVVGGTVTGAVLGAVLAGPGDAGAGAVVGAVAGAAVGAVSEASRANQTRVVEERVNDRGAARLAAQEERAGSYRRAISACLEGRGYTVK